VFDRGATHKSYNPPSPLPTTKPTPKLHTKPYTTTKPHHHPHHPNQQPQQIPTPELPSASTPSAELSTKSFLGAARNEWIIGVSATQQ
jgi:hypothetical protein